MNATNQGIEHGSSLALAMLLKERGLWKEKPSRRGRGRLEPPSTPGATEYPYLRGGGEKGPEACPAGGSRLDGGHRSRGPR